MKSSPFTLFFSPVLPMLVAIVGGWISAGTVAAEEHPGAKVYRTMCAECHGKKGEGVAQKYDDPLVGSRSLVSLTRYISRTMPEGKEGTCVGADAENVAAFIHDAFYSAAAQARNHPVRQDLARLTVAQYQNSVTDLLGLLRGGSDRAPGSNHGLKARYTGKKPAPYGPPAPDPRNDDERGRRDRSERATMERVDAQVAFHFGAESPDPLKLREDQFNLRWDGSLYAPETGFYELVVRTENGVRLSLNSREPILDAWVTPGPEVREEKRRVFLLGGRSYSLELEHFKFKDKSASIELLWKPPHGRLEVIPSEMLEPQGQAMKMIVTTPFPADDRSDGFERGTTISKEWDQATTRAALETVAYVEANLESLAGAKPGAADRPAKLKEFARRLVEGAFRRPLTEEQRQRYVEQQFAAAPDAEAAVKRVVLLALKSPCFLYPELSHDGKADDFSVASRLALLLWDSIPDQRLTRAAREGKLRKPEQIAAEAARMVADPRTKAKLHGFFHEWLELDRAESASKDAKVFPGFDEAMMADLRESLWRFVDEVVWSDASDYRQLIAADYLWLNDRLAKFYGKKGVAGDFQRVPFDPAQRSGVITHPYLLAALSYARTSSPIHRGVFLSRNIVGLTLKNPSVAVAFEDAKFDPTLTMREKVSELTKNESCMGCHSAINPLGFSLEHFDAVGRWRVKDNNKPVNAVGELETEEGQTLRLTGPKDLAQYAVTSESAHRAFVRQLFNHTVKQPPLAYGERTLEELRARFASDGFSVKKLLAHITVLAAAHGLPDAAPKVAAQASSHDASPNIASAAPPR